jgi:hypothetical protein
MRIPQKAYTLAGILSFLSVTHDPRRGYNFADNDGLCPQRPSAMCGKVLYSLSSVTTTPHTMAITTYTTSQCTIEKEKVSGSKLYFFGGSLVKSFVKGAGQMALKAWDSMCLWRKRSFGR